jgi:hypothetical protein
VLVWLLWYVLTLRNIEWTATDDDRHTYSITMTDSLRGGSWMRLGFFAQLAGVSRYCLQRSFRCRHMCSLRKADMNLFRVRGMAVKRGGKGLSLQAFDIISSFGLRYQESGRLFRVGFGWLYVLATCDSAFGRLYDVFIHIERLATL